MLKQISKILLAAVLLCLILKNVDLTKFYANVKAQDRCLLILAFLSVPIWIFLKTLKWKILLQSYMKGLPGFQVMRSFLAGLAIGMVTPGKIGELSRAFFIPLENKGRIVGLVLLDRYLDLLILLFFVSFGTYHFLGVNSCFSVISGGFVGIGVLLSFQRISRKEVLLKKSNIFVEKLHIMVKALEPLDFWAFLPLFVVTAATMLLSILTSYCLLLSFTQVPFMAALNVFPLVLMTNIIPISFGNLGIRECATIFLMGTYGVSEEISLNAALSLFVLHTLIPGLLGTVFIQLRYKKP